MAVGRRHREALLRGAGREAGPRQAELPKQHDRKGWPVLRERFAAAIASRTRDEWERIFEGSDACVAPVLALGEVESHPHNVARATFVGATACCSRARATLLAHAMRDGPAGPSRGVDSEAVLTDWGYAPAEIAALKTSGVVGAA